jgi:hypothetical protein
MVSSNDDDRKTHPPVDEPEDAASNLLSEEGGDAATPGRDLAAASVVGVVAILAVILGLLMPNPEKNIFTAPGFMPILTGLSLLAMAIGLGAGALKRGGGSELNLSPAELLGRYFADYENQWALILMGLVVVYIVLLDWVTFIITVPLVIGGFRLGFSSFEAVTIPMLAIALRIFWPKSFLQCFIVAAISTLVLAAAFRYGFRIPLPGSG